ncbi:propionyl-CoA synthetase [Flectobacillus sp. BAB-3569]|uniref:propionyl-CoA synthetase n=1 Tax=Flectobacillus sp. BAB-3569 TaxID=1509483 RepID=UPI000BA3D333|nr:propionyl-CoA synthetase [Flectobacillus sp. BAB-3569]PAC32457.1 propionyl-CoA synthetase [Flectobacillus sp. BAB-3569]
MSYAEKYQFSIDNREAFWAEQAQQISWFEAPEQTLSVDEKGFYRWFKGGKMNTAYLALDYHVENGRGDQTAIIYDSPATKSIKKYSYSELTKEVAKLAGGLKTLGVQKGDTVVIYMPMVPEAAIAMLACARLGAVHSVVFGGFAPHELAVRIDDAKPKVMISASCGIEFEKVISYKPLLDEAIEASEHKPAHCVILQRPQAQASMIEIRDVDYTQLVEQSDETPCEIVDATDPLYILYTSGTTGKPKGIVRDNGGHAVAMNFSMRAIYDVQPGDVYWAASDVGWVVGHSYIVYAPLIYGCTTILFEGKPIKTPDAGTFWRVIEEHKVKCFFTAPTAFRAIKKEDPHAELKAKYDISSLKAIYLAGERCDPPTLEWLQQITQLPILDHWWQTETGWGIVGNMVGIEAFPVKAGSATKPVCGFELKILNEAGEELGPNQDGYVCIKLPMPPGCLPTLWNDDDRFRTSYLTTFEGYYLTGDGGFIDQDGYVFIMGRIDDVINVAGHRLSTGAMEEIIASHPAVAECAVVGIADELRGQRPVGFAVLKDGQDIDENTLEQQSIALIREQIGAVAFYRNTILVKRLPKTRSGKILRKIIRQIADGESFNVPSTIDDPAILDEITQRLQERNIGLAYTEKQV